MLCVHGLSKDRDLGCATTMSLQWQNLVGVVVPSLGALSVCGGASVLGSLSAFSPKNPSRPPFVLAMPMASTALGCTGVSAWVSVMVVHMEWHCKQRGTTAGHTQVGDATGHTGPAPSIQRPTRGVRWLHILQETQPGTKAHGVPAHTGACPLCAHCMCCSGRPRAEVRR